MYCTYCSADGCSIWNKKQTSYYFHSCGNFVQEDCCKANVTLQYLWYSDAWLKYPKLATEADVFFFKYMFLSCKQDKEQYHNGTANDTDDSNKNFTLKMIMNKSAAYLELHTCISPSSNCQEFVSKSRGHSYFLPLPLDAISILTLRRLMSYIYGAPILDVSRSHTTTQHSR